MIQSHPFLSPSEGVPLTSIFTSGHHSGSPPNTYLCSLLSHPSSPLLPPSGNGTSEPQDLGSTLNGSQKSGSTVVVVTRNLSDEGVISTYTGTGGHGGSELPHGPHGTYTDDGSKPDRPVYSLVVSRVRGVGGGRDPLRVSLMLETFPSSFSERTLNKVRVVLHCT